MQEIRCGNCHRKLAMGAYTHLSIKCPRCRTMNDLRAASSAPESQRAPLDGDRGHDGTEHAEHPSSRERCGDPSDAT
ncbi:Com family DNA-binding transcriptional regulator [Cupriavidus nantongensis]|uniref:Com family DNA-binding transcriptional regulator n=1 Tax=Cupriavidus nantongensis TaxID=1796606 RepID=UPI0009EDD8B6|nr:Com family DNA-binding transcriptional regulator [Cupriavidus nantongensis]